MYYTCDALIPAMISHPLARTVSLTRIIMGHHYKSNNFKVIHHIHIAQIKVSYYIDSWITIEFNIMKYSSFGNKAEAALTSTTIQGPPWSIKMQSPWYLFKASAPSWLPSLQVDHHWATRTCHSSHNIQASLYTINFTSKAWATEAQQDWSINVVINSRLLAWKAIG
jgi:hypothetical protein